MYWNWYGDRLLSFGWLININMRCIEITIYDPYDLECSWLTLTWDVLKLRLSIKCDKLEHD